MARKRMHPWALGIAAVVVLFPVAMLVMALVAGRSDPNMVTDRYYEKDKNYQATIDIARRSAALAEPPSLACDAGARSCVLRFPPSFPPATVAGSAHFFRASDRRMDFTRPIALDSNGAQLFPLAGVARGAWQVKLSWTAGGLEYFIEQRFVVP